MSWSVCEYQSLYLTLFKYVSISSEDDLILKDILGLVSQSPQVTVHHVLSRPTEQWKGRSGHVDLEMATNLMPPASSSTFVCACGPKGFYETVSGGKGPKFTQGEVGGILKEMGFTKDQVFKI